MSFHATSLAASSEANILPPEKVLIVTADSRILVGTLTAADNSTNLVRATLPSKLRTPRTISNYPNEKANERWLFSGAEQRDRTNHPRTRRP